MILCIILTLLASLILFSPSIDAGKPLVRLGVIPRYNPLAMYKRNIVSFFFT